MPGMYQDKALAESPYLPRNPQNAFGPNSPSVYASVRTCELLSTL